MIKIYSIYDSKMAIFAQPFFARTEASALREWLNLSNDETQAINRNPEDYTLFYLGEWDDQKGSIETPKAPISMGSALEQIHIMDAMQKAKTRLQQNQQQQKEINQ